MSLVSLACFKFALITVLLYFIVPKKAQWFVLFIANIVFYISYGVKYIVFLLAAGIVSYCGALLLERENLSAKQQAANAKAEKAADSETAENKEAERRRRMGRKKTIALFTILLIISSWVVLKYGNFIAGNVVALASVFVPSISFEGFSWVLPLGMSFYTFHAIGYVVDIYRKKYPAEKNFLKYFTFLAFFPHMIQGPFSRFGELSKSMFRGNSFSWQRLCEGTARIIWGAFKKVVIADPTASTVNMILGSYNEYGGIQIIFAIFLYSIRLYADFSGYMDIVCGFCRILDIGLEENFKQPFFAKTVDEYWRRWHITLGKWFRDYVFYPASMSKAGMKLSKWARGKWGPKLGKLISGYFAMLFVWTATGLWHGANWTYLAWGYLNLIVMCSTMQLSDTYTAWKDKLHIRSESFGWKLFCMIRTFMLISFFRFFSVAPDLGAAVSTIGHTFADFRISLITQPSAFLLDMFREEIVLAGIGVVAMFTVDILVECGKWEKVKTACPIVLRAFAYSAMIVMIALMIKGADISQGFMYANF